MHDDRDLPRQEKIASRKGYDSPPILLATNHLPECPLSGIVLHPARRIYLNDHINLKTTKMKIPDAIKANPKIKFLHNRFLKTIELTAEKVAGHLKDPQQYPLPGNNTLERAMYDLLMALPDKRRKKFIEKHDDLLSASPQQRQQHYGDLATINIRDAATVADHVKNLAVPQNMRFSEQEIKEVADLVHPGKKTRKGAAPVVQQAAAATTLSVILDTLTCNKTSEIRKDEVKLGAFFQDTNGNTQNKDAFFVGEFKKGQSIPLGNNANLFSVAIDDSSTGGVFPQTFLVSLFLVEEDLIHNVALMGKIEGVLGIIGIVFSAVAIGMFIVAVLSGPFSPLLFFIAAGLGVFGSVMSIQVLPVITDDISPTVTDQLILDAPPAIGDTVSRTVNFELINWTGDLTPGSYTGALRWVAS